MGFELCYQHELYRIEIFDEIELKDKQKLFSIPLESFGISTAKILLSYLMFALHLTFRHLPLPLWSSNIPQYLKRTNPKHHLDWKVQTSSTKYWIRPRLSFLYSINLELQSENTGHHKPSTNLWDGEFLYRITSYRILKTICDTTWMNLCHNLESDHDSLKNRNLKKIFPIRRKPNILKKI